MEIDVQVKQLGGIKANPKNFLGKSSSRKILPTQSSTERSIEISPKLLSLSNQILHNLASFDSTFTKGAESSNLAIPKESTHLIRDWLYQESYVLSSNDSKTLLFVDPQREQVSRLGPSFFIAQKDLSEAINARFASDSNLSDFDVVCTASNEDKLIAAQKLSEARERLGLKKWIPLKQLVSWSKVVKALNNKEKYSSKYYKESCDYYALNQDMHQLMCVENNVEDEHLDHIINNQSEQKYRSIVELTSNAIDANSQLAGNEQSVKVEINKLGYKVIDNGTGMSPQVIIEKLLIPTISGKSGDCTIGRFGVGFYTALSHLNNHNDYVKVTTSDGSQAYKITFQKRKEIGDICVNIQELGEGIERGTTVEVKTQEFDQGAAEEILKNSLKYNKNSIIELESNHKQEVINDLSNFEKIDCKSSGEYSNSVVLSSKGINNSNICNVSILVNGVTIESEEVRGTNLPKELVLDYPLECTLPESRSELAIDDVALGATVDMIKTVFEDQNLTEQNKIAIANALYPIVDRIQVKNKLSVDVKESLIKSFNKHLNLNATQVIPNKQEYKFLNTTRVALNPNLLDPDFNSNGSKLFKDFEPGMCRKMYLMDFPEDSNKVVLIDGDILIMNKKVFGKHKDDSLFLNTFLNSLMPGGKQFGRIPSSDEIVEKQKEGIEGLSAENDDNGRQLLIQGMCGNAGFWGAVIDHVEKEYPELLQKSIELVKTRLVSSDTVVSKMLERIYRYDSKDNDSNKVYAEEAINFLNESYNAITKLYQMPVIKQLLIDTKKCEYDLMLDLCFYSIDKDFDWSVCDLSDSKKKLLEIFYIENKSIFQNKTDKEISGFIFNISRLAKLSDVNFKNILPYMFEVKGMQPIGNEIVESIFQKLLTCKSSTIPNCLSFVSRLFSNIHIYSTFASHKQRVEWSKRVIDLYQNKFSKLSEDEYKRIEGKLNIYETMGGSIYSYLVQPNLDYRSLDKDIRPYVMYIKDGAEELESKEFSDIKPGSYDSSFQLSQLALAKSLKNSSVESFNGSTRDLEEFLGNVAQGKDLEKVKANINHSIYNQVVNNNYLWIRELIQNSLNAILTSSLSEEERNIFVKAYLEKTEQNIDDLVLSFEDPIGMNLKEVINYLLVSGKSKWRYDAKAIGKFGQGFFTIFKDCKEIRIKTAKGDGKTAYFNIKPLNKHGQVVKRGEKIFELDVQASVIEESSKGTKIEKVISSDMPEIEATFCKDALIRNAGLVDTSKVNIFYQDTRINLPTDLYAECKVKNKLDSCIGSLRVYSAKENCVTQNGLYIRDIDYDYLIGIPTEIREILLQEGIVVDIPKEVDLTKSRNNIAKKEDILPLLQKHIPKLALELYLKKFVRGEVAFDNLPYDFFDLNQVERNTKSYIVEDALLLSRGGTLSSYEPYLRNPRALTKLMARVKFLKLGNEKVSLLDIVKKLKDNPNLNLDTLPKHIQGLLKKAKENYEEDKANLAMAKKLYGKDSTMIIEDFSLKAIPRAPELKLSEDISILFAFDALTKAMLEYLGAGDIDRRFYYQINRHPAHAIQNSNRIGWNLHLLPDLLGQFKQVLNGELSKLDENRFFENVAEILAHERQHNLENGGEESHDPEFENRAREDVLAPALLKKSFDKNKLLEKIKADYPEALTSKISDPKELLAIFRAILN